MEKQHYLVDRMSAPRSGGMAFWHQLDPAKSIDLSMISNLARRPGRTGDGGPVNVRIEDVSLWQAVQDFFARSWAEAVFPLRYMTAEEVIPQAPDRDFYLVQWTASRELAFFRVVYGCPSCWLADPEQIGAWSCDSCLENGAGQAAEAIACQQNDW